MNTDLSQSTKKKKNSTDVYAPKTPMAYKRGGPLQKKNCLRLLRHPTPHLTPFYYLQVLMAWYTNGSSRSSSSQWSTMQSQPLVSPQDSSTPIPQYYREASGPSMFSQLTQDSYIDTQMERNMEDIFNEVTAVCRSRPNGSSSTDGDHSADLERPTK